MSKNNREYYLSEWEAAERRGFEDSNLFFLTPTANNNSWQQWGTPWWSLLDLLINPPLHFVDHHRHHHYHDHHQLCIVIVVPPYNNRSHYNLEWWWQHGGVVLCSLQLWKQMRIEYQQVVLSLCCTAVIAVAVSYHDVEVVLIMNCHVDQFPRCSRSSTLLSSATILWASSYYIDYYYSK